MKKREEKKKEITLETILEKIEGIFYSVNVKLSSIDLKLNEHDLQFQKMARRSDRMEVILKKDINDIAVATARGFSNMQTEILDTEERLTNKMQGIERRIDNMAENKANKEQLRQLDIRLTKVERKVG